MTPRRGLALLRLAPLMAALLAGCLTQERLLSDVRRGRADRYGEWLSARRGESDEGAALSGPLSLDESILIALANSRRIKTVVLERDKAAAQITGAYSAALPSVDASAVYTRLDRHPDFGFGMSGAPDQYAASATARQPLYRGGLIGAGIRAAKVYAALVDEQQRAAYQAVIYDVRRAYYEVLLAEQLATAAAEAVSVARRRLDDARKDRAAGAAADFDVLRAEVEVKNLLAEQVAAENRRRLGASSLLNVMGVSQDSDVSLTYNLTASNLSPTVEEAVRLAFENHPDILQREMEVRLRREAVAAARADYFPRLDLFFTQGITRPDSFDPTQDRWEDYWRAGVELTIPLFSGFRTVSQVRQEKATLAQSRVALRDKEEEILLSIRQALLSLADARRLVESQEANVQQAREALRLSELGFRQGRLKEIDFLDARRSLTRAQANFAQALFNFEVARLDYERATGTLAPPAESGAERKP